jgi:hypothetical protein
MATIVVGGETRTIEPRLPRAGEYFRVRQGADRRKDATVLDDAPEKGVVSDIGYHLVADEFAPTLWADERIRPHLRRVTIYECASEDGNYFLWAVDEHDADGHAMAKAAET